MRLLSNFIFVVLFGLVSAPAFAGNEHEHLQYLATYEEVREASRGRLKSFPAKWVIENPFSLIQGYGEETIAQLLPSNVPYRIDGKVNGEPVRKALQEIIDRSTLEQLSEKIAQVRGNSENSEQIMRRFFSSESSRGIDGYLFSSDSRSNLFKNRPALLIDSIRIHLERQPRSSTLKSLFSVPDSLTNRSTLSRIQSLFASRGMQAQFFYSIPRYTLLKSTFDFADRYEVMNQGIREGWLHGIDITGSIREGAESAKINPKALEFYRKNLGFIFDFSHRTNTAVRIHAFEGANQGPFYDAFWETLAEKQATGTLPRQIRVGHIHSLTNEDIGRFGRLPRSTAVVFEVNLGSNQATQSSFEIPQMVKKIETLHNRGFRVVLGADGFGILGAKASDFESSLRRLQRAGLSEKALERLIRDAFLPVRNTRTVGKAQLLDWQLKREDFRKSFFGERYRALIPACDYSERLELLFAR